jgi:hypothetical protein
MPEIKLQLPPAIAANIERFTGRTWLLPTLLTWYEQTSERIFLLVGKPGTGKSMITAWLAGYGPAPADPVAVEQLERLRGQVKAVHFCIVDNGSTDPKDMARQMAMQLTRKVLGFSTALAATLSDQVQIVSNQQIGSVEPGGSNTGVYIANLNLGGLSEELSFNRILRDPLKRLYKDGYDEPMLLALDALDEALTYKGATNIVELLAKLADLPPQVRILCTTRPDSRVLRLIPEARSFDLIKDAPQDVDDVKQYVLEQLPVKDGLDDEQRTLLATRLSQESKGIFLYAYMVLGDLLPRLPQVPDLETYPLPDGLIGLYREFLNRELGQHDDPWYESFKPVLGLIAVAQGEGLTQTQLKAISRKDVEQPLHKCKQYLAGELPEGPFRVFHKSFADFLLEDEDNVDRHIDAATMHGQIADYYWQKYHSNWKGCDAYGLSALATHLYRAGQFERLASLIDQSWMTARFESSNYTYDGFVADLDLAWRQAHHETLQQIDAGKEPAALAQCVRYALIRTSINSLSENYVPELVAQAVETGLWPAEQALSLASRVPVGQRRVDMYLALWKVKTKALTDAQRQQALEQALAAALAIGDEWYRAEALAALAPQLTGEAREQALAQGLAAALAIGEEYYRVRALAALASQLTGEAREQALEQALAAALAIGDKIFRAKALAALAPLLTGEAREQALAQGLAAARASGEEWYRAEALAALAPQLTGELLAQGLAAALAISDQGSRAKALVALAPQLTGEAREQALAQGLAAALASGDKRYRVRALAALAPQLTGEAREQALAQGLAAALAIGYKWYRASARADALAALAPQLTGEAHEQALARGLAAALAIGDEWRRADALAALAPQLTGEAREQALAQRLAAARAIDDERYRESALAALARQLTRKARKQLLVQGLVVARAIGDERDQAYALAALVPLAIGVKWLMAQVRAALDLTGETLEQAQYLVLAVLDQILTQVWAALVSYQTGETREQALARRLAAWAIDDERHRAQDLAVAVAIGEERHRAQALAVLAPQLTGELRAQGLAAALAISDQGSRAKALVAFIPYSPDDTLLFSHLRRAITAHLYQDLSSRNRAEVLDFIASRQLFAPPIVGTGTLATIASHIVEICSRWHWQ